MKHMLLVLFQLVYFLIKIRSVLEAISGEIKYNFINTLTIAISNLRVIGNITLPGKTLIRVVLILITSDNPVQLETDTFLNQKKAEFRGCHFS